MEYMIKYKMIRNKKLKMNLYPKKDDNKKGI